MMIIVNRTGDYITGSVNGAPFSVAYDEVKFNKMIELRDKSEQVQTMDELKTIVEEFKPLSEESFKEIVETATPYLVVNKSTNKYYLRWANVVSRHALPKVLVDRILKSLEKGIDITPLIKCWARYIREIPGRPAFTAKRAQLFADYISASYTDEKKVQELIAQKGLDAKVAREFATTPQVAITSEGLLVTYKVSNEITKKFVKDEEAGVKQIDRYDYDVDEFTGLKTYKEPEFVEDRVFEPAVMGQTGDAFKSGDYLGHIIRVGLRHELDSWDKVDCNDSVSGRKGLHVGGLSYIAGFQNNGTVTHNVFVDPSHIGAIVGLGYGNDGAMRVISYFVHSSFAGPNRNIYHSSKYAEITDAEYDKLIHEVAETSKLKQNELVKEFGEAEALRILNSKTSDGSPTTSAGDVLSSGL